MKNSIFTYWRYLSVLLVPILGSGAGCAAVAAGAAGGSGLAYMIGDLETKVNATPKEVAAAKQDSSGSIGHSSSILFAHAPPRGDRARPRHRFWYLRLFSCGRELQMVSRASRSIRSCGLETL